MDTTFTPRKPQYLADGSNLTTNSGMHDKSNPLIERQWSRLFHWAGLASETGAETLENGGLPTAAFRSRGTDPRADDRAKLGGVDLIGADGVVGHGACLAHSVMRGADRVWRVRRPVACPRPRLRTW